MPDDLIMVRRQTIIIPTKRDNLEIRLTAQQSNQTVCHHTTTRNQLTGRQPAIITTDNDIVFGFRQSINGTSIQNFTAVELDQFSELVTNRGVANDTRGRYTNRTKPGNIWLGLSQLIMIQDLDCQPVLFRPLDQHLHALNLDRVGRDQQFSAFIELDAMFQTK